MSRLMIISATLIGYTSCGIVKFKNNFEEEVAQSSSSPNLVRVSINDTGVEANGSNAFPMVSADGRYVTFYSSATNLVAGDTNGFADIFVKDMNLLTVSRISVSSAGVEGNAGTVYVGNISTDGRYAVFGSNATNLVAGDTNATDDIFVRDMLLNTTTRVSLTNGGAQANGSSVDPIISGDGRYVAFRSLATNLVAGDTNGVMDHFVRDLVGNTTIRVSVSTGGVEGNAASPGRPSISSDGRYVVFHSNATNLVAGDTNALADVFVRDTILNTTSRVSVDGVGTEANNNSTTAVITPDGRYVAFLSNATNLDPIKVSALSADGFVKDLITGAVSLVSKSTAGVVGGNLSCISISDNGRFTAFATSASNLVTGDTNGQIDVFMHDSSSSTTERISVSNSGTQANATGVNWAWMVGDGKYVVMNGGATNLDLITPDTNGVNDVFLRRNW